MITADQARQLGGKDQTFEEVITDIDNWIIRATKNGIKSISFSTLISDLCLAVQEDLESKGYKVKHDFDSKSYGTDPNDPNEYTVSGIHHLTISWYK